MENKAITIAIDTTQATAKLEGLRKELEAIAEAYRLTKGQIETLGVLLNMGTKDAWKQFAGGIPEGKPDTQGQILEELRAIKRLLIAPTYTVPASWESWEEFSGYLKWGGMIAEGKADFGGVSSPESSAAPSPSEAMTLGVAGN